MMSFSAKNELFLAKMLVYEQGRSEREENARLEEEKRKERIRILKEEAVIKYAEEAKEEEERKQKAIDERNRELFLTRERAAYVWGLVKEKEGRESEQKFTRVYKPRDYIRPVYMLYRDENMSCPYYEYDESDVAYSNIDNAWIQASYKRLAARDKYMPYLRFVAWFYTSEEREKFVKDEGRRHFGCYD